MRTFLLFLLFVVTNTVFGQKGYYVLKDSVLYVNVKVIESTDIENAEKCQVLIKNKVVEFSPYDVSEYGFTNGKKYFSRLIRYDTTEKRVFLEQLNKGKINLFYYKDRKGRKFFLEKDSGQIKEISKKTKLDTSLNYKTTITTLMEDCYYATEAIKYVSYNRPSLIRITGTYDKCSKRPFPFTKFGLITGFGGTKLTSEVKTIYSTDNLLTFKIDGSFYNGLFIDIPILSSYFSIHSEINYTQNGFVINKRTKDYEIDIIAKTHTLSFPLIIRYIYPFEKFQPFINIGGVYNKYLKSNAQGRKTAFSDNIVEIGNFIDDVIQFNQQIGYTIGGGLAINLNTSHSLFIEIRYYNTYETRSWQSTKTTSAYLLTGINF
jgi:hypothetical protein